MKFYKKLNPLKRRVFNLITGSLKNHNAEFCISDFQNRKIKILITRPNHRLGNQLLISPLIQTIERQIPNCEIDILVNGSISKSLYENYESIRNVYDLPKKPFNNLSRYIKTSYCLLKIKYDLGISASETSNSGKIFLKLSRCNHKIFDSGVYTLNKPEHVAKSPVYNFMSHQIKIENPRLFQYPKMDIKLSEREIITGKNILKTLFPNNKKTISIFTFATGSKIFSKNIWESIYMYLKNYTDYNILEILPKENVSQINFNAMNFYSRNLREIAAVIENCEYFMGADSGIMHLATATNTNTIGLFNVTKPESYGPYGNLNRSITIDESSEVSILKKIKEAVI